MEARCFFVRYELNCFLTFCFGYWWTSNAFLYECIYSFVLEEILYIFCCHIEMVLYLVVTLSPFSSTKFEDANCQYNIISLPPSIFWEIEVIIFLFQFLCFFTFVICSCFLLYFLVFCYDFLPLFLNCNLSSNICSVASWHNSSAIKRNSHTHSSNVSFVYPVLFKELFFACCHGCFECVQSFS